MATVTQRKFPVCRQPGHTKSTCPKKSAPFATGAAPPPPPTPACDRVHKEWLARFNAKTPPLRFDIFIKNLDKITFDIVWIPMPPTSPATAQPRTIHTNVSPGMTRKLSVGMRGHRFRLVVSCGNDHFPPGTNLADLQTFAGSTDNFVFTGNRLVELEYGFPTSDTRSFWTS